MAVTTPDAVYDLLKAAVLTILPYSGRILMNEQTPRTSRERSFWLIPERADRADDMVTQGQGYRWIEESYIVRLSHTFKGKRQEASRKLAYDDAKAVWDAVEVNPGLLGVSPLTQIEARDGPVLSDTGNFIDTDLTVTIRYQEAT